MGKRLSALTIALGPDWNACFELRPLHKAGRSFGLAHVEGPVRWTEHTAILLENPDKWIRATRPHAHATYMKVSLAEVLPHLGTEPGDEQVVAELPQALPEFYLRTRRAANERVEDGVLLEHMRSYLAVLRTVDDPAEHQSWTAKVEKIPFDPWAGVDELFLASDDTAARLLAEIRRERTDIYQWSMDIAHSGLEYPRSKRGSRP